VLDLRKIVVGHERAPVNVQSLRRNALILVYTCAQKSGTEVENNYEGRSSSGISVVYIRVECVVSTVHEGLQDARHNSLITCVRAFVRSFISYL